MKVTIEIPEPLYRKAKIRAAQRGEGLAEIAQPNSDKSARIGVICGKT